MAEINKNPDRLYTSKKAKEIINKIDDQNFLNLDNHNTNRSELFAFAMSIAVNSEPIKLENINQGGLVKDNDIDNLTKALIYSLYISKLKDYENLDAILNKVEVYKTAEEYANTGFLILDDYLNNKKEESLIWELLSELDKTYNELYIE